MKTIVPVFVLAALLAGCASPRPATRPTSMEFNANKEAVWPVVVSQIATDYPVKVIEKVSGIITTDWVSLPAGYAGNKMGAYVERPGGFLAVYNKLRVSLTVLVSESDSGKTTVNIKGHFEAFEYNVSGAWIVCESNGFLENSLLEKIAAIVKK